MDKIKEKFHDQPNPRLSCVIKEKTLHKNCEKTHGTEISLKFESWLMFSYEARPQLHQKSNSSLCLLKPKGIIAKFCIWY